jgi:hypothetical protein
MMTASARQSYGPLVLRLTIDARAEPGHDD